MTWLLSLLGGGGAIGLVAAWFLIPGASTFLRSLAGTALRWVTASTTHLLLVALAVALAWGAWEHRGNVSKKRQIANMTAAHVKELAKIEQASEQARRDQIALNQATEARYRTESEKTDAEHHKAIESALRASERYAATHRVRADCARSPVATSAPTPADDPARDNGPGEDAIVVSRADFDTLTENTLRLQAAHDWAERLIADGLAKPMPEPQFGQPRTPPAP